MKEFDIFLNKRLTECDIIVSAIPYRDGLTIVNRMILECCLEAYLLHKFVAVQAGSELTSRIDRMIKTCHERLNFGQELRAEAEFSSTSKIMPISTEIELGASQVQLFANTYEQAVSDILLAIDPFKLTLKKYLGGGSSGIAVNTELRNVLKRSIERFESGVTFGAAVDGLAEQNFERATADIEVDAELKNLLYRVYRSGEAMMDIAAVVESIQLHRILGIAEAGIELDADIGGGAVTKKFLTAEHGIDLLTEVTETFTQYMKPEMVTVALDTSASAILRRFRKVSEVDPLSLASIDTMTLDELDYVVLSG